MSAGRGDLRGGEQAPGPAWSLTIRNDIAAVGEANRSLEAFLESRDVDPETILLAALVLEEAVTNAIKYGYDDAGPHGIFLQARVFATELELRITDDGHEFDPLRAPPPDFEKPIEERSEGGLGIHLLKNLARSAAYERIEGKNVLTLRLDLKPTH